MPRDKILTFIHLFQDQWYQLIARARKESQCEMKRILFNVHHFIETTISFRLVQGRKNLLLLTGHKKILLVDNKATEWSLFKELNFSLIIKIHLNNSTLLRIDTHHISSSMFEIKNKTLPHYLLQFPLIKSYRPITTISSLIWHKNKQLYFIITAKISP